MTTTTHHTLDDLRALPEGGRSYELIAGELHKMSPSNFRHGDLTLAIGSLLRAHAQARKLGRVIAEGGFVLARHPDTVVAPDVAFVRQSRLPAAGSAESFFNGAPDLAIEILSPNDRADEVEQKIQLYLRHGTSVVWVVAPKTQSVTIHRADGTASRLNSNETLTEPALLPGFACPVAELFAE